MSVVLKVVVVARKKKDDVSRETLFVSMYFGIDSAIKTLSIHPAYTRLCDDLRNLLKLASPLVQDYMGSRNVVENESPDTDH